MPPATKMLVPEGSMHIKTSIVAATISVLAAGSAMALHAIHANIRAACRSAVHAIGLHGDAYHAEYGKCKVDPKAYHIDY